MKRFPNRVLKLGLSLALVAVILSAVAAFGLMVNAKTVVPTKGPGSEPLRVNTHAVQWETGYTIERHFVGRVEARRSSDVGFEISGMVTQVLVEEGELVEAGQVLARLDTRLMDARRAELVAARNRAQADYELADVTRQRTRGSASRGAATPQEIDNAEQAYLTTSAALEQARAAVDSIDVQIGKAQITSPFAAVVSRRHVDEGRVVSPGTPVVRLLESRNPEVRVGIGGDLIEAVQVDQVLDVVIRGDALKGTVTAILPIRGAEARGVDVLIRLDTSLNGIRQGDLARVAVTRALEADGFWAPTQSLTEGVRGLWALYLIQADEAHGSNPVLKRIDVEVLHTTGDAAYVRGALEDGSHVVANGLQRVAPGMAVRTGAPERQAVLESP